MTSTKTLSLSATMAIAAVLALGSNSAAAQSVTPDAAPAPAAAAPVVQTPTIVLPPVTSAAPAAARSAVRSQVPVKAAPVKAAAPKNAPIAAAAPAIAPITKTPAKTPIESSGRSTPFAPVPLSGPSTAQVSPSAATPPATTRTSDNNPETAWEIGLAALVGVGLAGGIGLTMANARRRRELLAVEEAAYGDAVSSTTPPEPAAAPAYTAPLAAEPVVVAAPAERPLHQPFASRFAPAPAMAFAPAGAVEAEARPTIEALLPAGPVPKGEEREALIARMVAAEPDAENPFTSAKSRRHRARMILSQREGEQRRDATQPFDWRTYRDLPKDDLSQQDPQSGEPGLHKTPVPASA
jgi:hypothetical protein